MNACLVTVWSNGWNGGVDFVLNALALRSCPTCTWLRLAVCMLILCLGKVLLNSVCVHLNPCFVWCFFAVRCSLLFSLSRIILVACFFHRFALLVRFYSRVYVECCCCCCFSSLFFSLSFRSVQLRSSRCLGFVILVIWCVIFVCSRHDSTILSVYDLAQMTASAT